MEGSGQENQDVAPGNEFKTVSGVNVASPMQASAEEQPLGICLRVFPLPEPSESCSGWGWAVMKTYGRSLPKNACFHVSGEILER